MAEALKLDAAPPLSSKRANAIGAGAAFKAAEIMAAPTADGTQKTMQSPLQKVLETVMPSGQQHQTFEVLVAEQAQRVAGAVAEEARSGNLSEEAASEFDERIPDHIRSLPPELRDNAMREALQSGDKAALALLATGTTAFSIGVGVNLAGFSAYILAAQASAFIPFMSGPAVVSTLFMLANPLFSISAVLSIGYLTTRHVNGGRATKLAATVCVQRSLRGLSAGQDGLAIALNDFRAAMANDLKTLSVEAGTEFISRATGSPREWTAACPMRCLVSEPSKTQAAGNAWNTIKSRLPSR